MKRFVVIAMFAVAALPLDAGSHAGAPGQRGALPPKPTPVAIPTPAGTPVATPEPSEYTFPSGAGMFFFYVKPDKGPIFEAVVGRIREVLDKTQDTTRRQQAASWKIYKSLEAPKEGLVYVFVFDPAIVSADYDPVRLLTDGLPAEAQGLYDRLKDALIRVERMGLTKIR